MGLSEQAILDNAQFSGDASSGFGVAISMRAPTGETATLNGFSTKHYLGIDGEGNPISTKKASVAFNELNLIAANALYPIRISDTSDPHYQAVKLTDHLVNVVDSTGIIKNYISRQSFPDEKLGMIVIILEDYKS